jgi:hypothetical protein
MGWAGFTYRGLVAALVAVDTTLDEFTYLTLNSNILIFGKGTIDGGSLGVSIGSHRRSRVGQVCPVAVLSSSVTSFTPLTTPPLLLALK